MSRFHVAPRQGHLDRVQRMYRYLKRHPDGAISLRTGIPDGLVLSMVPTAKSFQITYLLREKNLSMFRENQSVITSSNIPHCNLNKRHNALSYHHDQEAISAKIPYFIHIDCNLNRSDILTKFLSWVKLWPLIQPM
jgi:hypothetical protein